MLTVEGSESGNRPDVPRVRRPESVEMRSEQRLCAPGLALFARGISRRLADSRCLRTSAPAGGPRRSPSGAATSAPSPRLGPASRRPADRVPLRTATLLGLKDHPRRARPSPPDSVRTVAAVTWLHRLKGQSLRETVKMCAGRLKRFVPASSTAPSEPTSPPSEPALGIYRNVPGRFKSYIPEQSMIRA